MEGHAWCDTARAEEPGEGELAHAPTCSRSDCAGAASCGHGAVKRLFVIGQHAAPAPEPGARGGPLPMAGPEFRGAPPATQCEARRGRPRRRRAQAPCPDARTGRLSAPCRPTGRPRRRRAGVPAMTRRPPGGRVPRWVRGRRGWRLTGHPARRRRLTGHPTDAARLAACCLRRRLDARASRSLPPSRPPSKHCWHSAARRTAAPPCVMAAPRGHGGLLGGFTGGRPGPPDAGDPSRVLFTAAPPAAHAPSATHAAWQKRGGGGQRPPNPAGRSRYLHPGRGRAQRGG